MIVSFRHKGLGAFFLTGSKAGIQAMHAARLRELLTALSVARGPQDMNRPSWRLHGLAGQRAGFRGAKGGLFLPVPVDYLSWTEGVKTFAERKDLGAGARLVWLSGRASPKAAQGLKAHGWSLREDVALK
mgnify:CR=1 FL=1